MSAPLSGVAGSQQTTALQQQQTVQSVSNDQTRETRQANQQPRENVVQARSAATAQSQQTNETENAIFDERTLDFLNNSGVSSEQANQPRGSVVNLLV